MKRALRYLLIAVLTLCLTQAALADSTISVQIDGEPLVFTDAQPQVVNGRTFLPVRAVFEAMGAEVGYNDGVVTAVRDGKTITMTLGSTTATVTEDGVTTTLTMDVTPYADTALGRTFVPVRFAAQALGANVGWDQAAQTVVIVDAEKQVDDALEGKSFTYLEKLAAYSEQFNEGVWSTDMTLTGKVDLDLAAIVPETPLAFSVPVNASAKCVTADGSKLDMSGTVTADLASLFEQAKSLSSTELDPADLALADGMVSALSKDGVTYSLRGDLSTGKVYLNCDLSALESLLGANELPLDKDAWYAVDFEAVYRELGIDFDELMEQSKDFDYEEMIRTLLSSVDVNDSTIGYQAFDDSLQLLVDTLADDGFVKNGNVYTTTVERELDGIEVKAVLSLTMKDDAVTGCGFELSLLGSMESVGELSMQMKMAVDEQNKLSGTLSMELFDAVTVSFDLTGSYTKGGAAPLTTPPAGAKVVDLTDELPTLP